MKVHFRWTALAALATAASAQQYVDYAAHTELGSDVYDERWTGESRAIR